MRLLVRVLVVLSLLVCARAHAAVSCTELAAAPRATESDLFVGRILDVWQRVSSVTLGLTGLGADVRVLASGARMRSGEAFPPNAVTCGEPDGVVIYLTDTLVDLVFARERYPVDFLAFILGHELGHRINDLDAAGRPLKTPRGPAVAAFTGGGLPADREILADLRGAYFAAAGGFSVRRLTCDDCLNDYLRAEARLAPDVRMARKDALRGVLRDFETWETLYEAGAALAFWGFGAEAVRLLTWAEAETKRLAVPVPELDVLHALVLTMSAAESAPWLAQTRVPAAAVGHLRCAPIYPAHSALSEDAAPLEGDTRGAVEVEAARNMLLQARRILRDAEQMGASELVVATAQACVSVYLGQTKEAARDLARARKLLGASTPPEVERALAANEAFVALVGILRGKPIEAADQAGWKALRGELTSASKTLERSPAIAALVKSLDKVGPGVAPPPPAPIRSTCPASEPPSGVRLPDLPRASATGGCPCAWTPSGELRGANASPDSPALVSVCLPSGWGAGQRWVDVHLPASSGAPEPLALSLLMVDRVPAGLDAMGAWDKRCDQLERRGTSDQGDGIFAGQCPSLGLGNGLLIGGGQCRVDRAVILDLQ